MATQKRVFRLGVGDNPVLAVKVAKPRRYCFATLDIFAVCFGMKVPVWRERWQRCLFFAGGVVGRLTPIEVRFWGKERFARREAERIKKYGYRVTVKRDKKTKETVSK